MKHNPHILAHSALILSILQLQLLTPTLYASVPLRWTVETSRVQPVKFDAIHGETLDLEAVLLSNGKPLQLSDQGVPAIYWQTNGMGNVYWIGTAAAVSNRLCASFTPAMDVGAKSYTCFIGVAGSIYRAAFQLSMRQGPGASPNHLPLPTPTIDFSRVIVTNVPWRRQRIFRTDPPVRFRSISTRWTSTTAIPRMRRNTTGFAVPRNQKVDVRRSAPETSSTATSTSRSTTAPSSWCACHPAPVASPPSAWPRSARTSPSGW